ncbi:MAG: hypothetical protein R3331_03525 [Sulfurospirillaceae bacterium]|nr:hypothetical protein [Sulfurospirillaceae bacterium]
MVKILKLFFYIAFFVLALIFFVPKSSIYHYAEAELQKYKIIVSNEEVVDDGLSLELSHAIVSFDSIDSAYIEKINMKFFVFYNSIDVKNIKLSKIASSLVPLNIKTLDIKYTIFNPLHVIAHASGEFGKADAKINILDRNFTMVLTPSQMMFKNYKSTLDNLSKNKDGGYRYDQSF